MDHLSSILPKVLRKRGLHTHATASLVTHKAQQWLMAALPGLAPAIFVASLNHGTLVIHCMHSIAVQEVTELLPGLREFLQKDSPGAVKEVRVDRA